MKRGIGYHRKVAWRHALRKKRISDAYSCLDWSWYSDLHRYSKNKIHCSCALCAAKTRTHGWKFSDRKKMQALKYEDF